MSELLRPALCLTCCFKAHKTKQTVSQEQSSLCYVQADRI